MFGDNIGLDRELAGGPESKTGFSSTVASQSALERPDLNPATALAETHRSRATINR